MNLVKAILHLEGLAVLAAAVWFYFFELEASWIAFAVLILAPDLSMIGFVRGTRIGAITYNAVHNYALVIAVAVAGVVAGNEVVVALGLILAAHVGMDRMSGYGLKFPTHFKDTHMQRLAPAPQPAERVDRAAADAGATA